MPAIPIEPPHIRLTKAELAKAGLLSFEVRAALELAAKHYVSSTQVSKTDTFRQERNRTQEELERVSSDLVSERRKSERLKAELAAAVARPDERKKVVAKLRRQLRLIEEVVEHAEMKEAKKLKKIAFLVSTILKGAPADASSDADSEQEAVDAVTE